MKVDPQMTTLPPVRDAAAPTKRGRSRHALCPLLRRPADLRVGAVDRPLLVGGIAYTTLPIAQYPEIAPPTIVVRRSYPGADAQTVAATVATPLEQEINGVEDMLYMSSYSTADGAMSLTITFKLGTDLDKAQVLVQNRVASRRRGCRWRCARSASRR